MKTEKQMAAAAAEFAERWQGRGYERGESQLFWARIVFCLYAEDAGIFGRDQFHNYLVSYETRDLRNALIRLFEVLNTPVDKRSRYLTDDLKACVWLNCLSYTRS